MYVIRLYNTRLFKMCILTQFDAARPDDRCPSDRGKRGQ